MALKEFWNWERPIEQEERRIAEHKGDKNGEITEAYNIDRYREWKSRNIDAL